jgi:hypothetical protein
MVLPILLLVVLMIPWIPPPQSGQFRGGQFGHRSFQVSSYQQVRTSQSDDEIQAAHENYALRPKEDKLMLVVNIHLLLIAIAIGMWVAFSAICTAVYGSGQAIGAAHIHFNPSQYVICPHQQQIELHTFCWD